MTSSSSRLTGGELESPPAGTGPHGALPATLKSSARRFSGSPLAVAVLVLALYGIWCGGLFATGHDARAWILFGRMFAGRPHAQQLVHVDPHSPYILKGFGNDGQFYYYIAVDPVHAKYFMDDPGYRYKRILYPMLARVLALGQIDLIPYTLILINWLAVAGGTWAIAAWLKRKGISPSLALIYGLYPALLVTFQRDLTEPLSYALVALAVYLYSFGGTRQIVASPAAFALAVLTRDKSIAFAALYGAGLLVEGARHTTGSALFRLLKRNVGRALVFSFVLGLPVVAFQLFLALWLKDVPAATGQLGAPLSGAGMRALISGDNVVALLCVFIPAIVCLAMCGWALLRGVWRLEVAVLAITIVLSVFSVNASYYQDVVGGLMRVAIAVVLMALFAVPSFDALQPPPRWWLRISAGGWLLLVPTFLLLGMVEVVSSRL